MRDGPPECVGEESADKGAIVVSAVGIATGGLYPDEGPELFALLTDSIEAPASAKLLLVDEF